MRLTRPGLTHVGATLDPLITSYLHAKEPLSLQPVVVGPLNFTEIVVLNSSHAGAPSSTLLFPDAPGSDVSLLPGTGVALAVHELAFTVNWTLQWHLPVVGTHWLSFISTARNTEVRLGLAVASHNGAPALTLQTPSIAIGTFGASLPCIPRH